MKKSLVLAMAMALGVTASAYAANPFSDVPAGHWAYDSIDKLAAAGVIDGMGDGTFQGNKTMTRYEMAQIVAKAMAKGANVDKLAAEFADELDNLGVRVANLEKKADNVQISGMTRFNYWSFGANAKAYNSHEAGKNHAARQRTDIFINGKVNEDWTYTAMLRNQQYFQGASRGVGEERVDFQRAYVTGRVGGVKVTAGRYSEYLENGLIYDDRADGIVLSYGKDIKVTAGYAQLAPRTGGKEAAGSDHTMYARVDAKVAKTVNAHVGFYKMDEVIKNIGATPVSGDAKVWAAGIDAKLTKDLNLGFTFIKSDVDKIAGESVDNKGYCVALDYKGANRNKVGSYGISAKYYNQPASTFLAHTMDGVYFDACDTDATMKFDGFKGYMVGARFTAAKNVTLGVDYYGLKSRESNKHSDTLFSTLQFNF